MNAAASQKQRGFTLIELMVAAGVFLVLCGAAFGLLGVSQKSYQSQSQLLNSFQEARLGLDQIVRDVNISGYPSATSFSILPPPPATYAATPIAWTAANGYQATPCSVGVTCTTTPSDFDVIIETQPQGTTAVQWIRYQLQGTTLMRGMVPKADGSDPDGDTANALAPFVQNVMNNASAAEIGQFQAIYPQMYPGGTPVPIFTYMCDSAGVEQTCASVGGTPLNITDIEVTLIAKAPNPDLQTGQPRLVELNGRGHIINPMQ